MNEAIEMKKLISKLNEYNKLYDEGHPAISDEEYDKMYFHLKELEEQTGITYPNSPTQTINFDIVTSLSKVTHNHLMLSLDKTKDINEVQKFVSGHEWLGMFKLDGLSCSLTYENGELVVAETRGNGEVGESIIHNVLVIDNIPKIIPIKNRRVVVDGEIICTWSDFNKYLGTEFAHPRAVVSGSIRLLSSQEASKRKLRFIAWDLIEGEPDIDFFFWRLEKLDDWGFDTVPRVGDAETVSDAIEILDSMKNEYDYPIDGYVFKFESVKLGKELGRTDHHFKNAIAYKFYDEEYETELLNIEWSMGRTGILTPVAIFKPIEIDGTIVERASLHNVSVMQETLGQYPDLYQPIWVYKANMIIPQISRAIKNNIPHDHIIFAYDQWIPCPCCGKPIEFIESDTGVVNAICGNPLCEGKLENRIDHYLGKKGLDVKGISNMTIQKLIAWEWIDKLSDVYDLRQYQTEWINKPGFGPASVNKILDAIDNSRQNVDLTAFISAIGIPLVGKTIAKEITKYYSTWKDFRAAVGGDWTEFEGFGPEISKSINSFDYAEADDIAGILSFATQEVQSQETSTAATLQGKKFCATGKLQNFTRDSLKTDIEMHGGKMVSSVTSATDYLITNTPNSGTAKNASARKLGIPIITEQEYLEMRLNA